MVTLAVQRAKIGRQKDLGMVVVVSWLAVIGQEMAALACLSAKKDENSSEKQRGRNVV